MPCTVSGIAGAADRAFTKVAGMSAKAPLIDTSIRGAVKRQAAMLQFVDGIDSVTRQDFGGGLINQVVAAFDGVVHVPFPVVFFRVAESSRHASLGCSSVGARRIDLAEHRNAGVWQLHCSHQAGTSGTNDDHIKFIVHSMSSLLDTITNMTKGRRATTCSINRHSTGRPYPTYVRSFVVPGRGDHVTCWINLLPLPRRGCSTDKSLTSPPERVLYRSPS